MSQLRLTMPNGRRVVDRFLDFWIRCSRCGGPGEIVTYDDGTEEGRCLGECGQRQENPRRTP